ncbi:DUF6550 family protein [Tissierella creatinophila]|uniref:Uncharacterized protein n=1 Tax=Tissierella creatinophila DSM 6911 TaxID=1123403 RepID=A0A1U7M894_TISCR|nr:DUF6550 family protein [Tissierella creatinophila]OLS03543.1 hypothetical protein TICRE_04000 [Tissierella creatinophila DSM 6911]
MKVFNDRTKKWLVVASGLLICAALVFMISSKFQKEPVEEVALPSGGDTINDIIVEKDNEINIDKGNLEKIDDNTIGNAEKEDKEKIEASEKEINVPAIKVSDTQNNKNGVDKGTNQTIQGDVKKAKEPTKEELTDPTKKPDGEKVEEPPKNIDHDKVEKPEEPPKKKDEPQGGDKKDGKIFVPGFGWIDDVGEGEGTKVDGDGDINKQIGDMN